MALIELAMLYAVLCGAWWLWGRARRALTAALLDTGATSMSPESPVRLGLPRAQRGAPLAGVDRAADAIGPDDHGDTDDGEDGDQDDWIIRKVGRDRYMVPAYRLTAEHNAALSADELARIRAWSPVPKATVDKLHGLPVSETEPHGGWWDESRPFTQELRRIQDTLQWERHLGEFSTEGGPFRAACLGPDLYAVRTDTFGQERYRALPKTLSLRIGGGDMLSEAEFRLVEELLGEEAEILGQRPAAPSDGATQEPAAKGTAGNGPNGGGQKVALDDMRRYAADKSTAWADETSALDELRGLIGLETVKIEVEMAANLAWAMRQREREGLRVPAISRHMVFTGNPGTGKTTVARLIGRIYRDLGILKSGHLVEVDRGGLVAEYVGKTAPKVKAVIESACDGVLFIDEAYTLSRQGSERDYGHEAITTLLPYLEDWRDRIVVIVAGYKHEMERFLASNPGLQSRFQTIVHFPDYSPDELVQIFEKLCQDHDYVLNSAARYRLDAAIGRLHAGRNEKFGNGRAVRMLFEDCLRRQADRLRRAGSDDVGALRLLIGADIDGDGDAQDAPRPVAPDAAIAPAGTKTGKGASLSRPSPPIFMPGYDAVIAFARERGLLPTFDGTGTSRTPLPSRTSAPEVEEVAELERDNDELMAQLLRLGGAIEELEKKGRTRARK